VSMSNRWTSLCNTCSLTVVAVDELASISWAATEVTNSRPRSTVPRLRPCGRSQRTHGRRHSIRPTPTCLVPRSTLDSSNTRTVAVCSQDADTNPVRVANASVNPATFAMPTRVTIVPSSSDRLADVVHSMDTASTTGPTSRQRCGPRKDCWDMTILTGFAPVRRPRRVGSSGGLSNYHPPSDKSAPR
jgi:hypothetical protein